MVTTRRRRRWPEGAWMRIRSGKLLAGQMDARNMSQYALAGYAGCSRGFISHLVAGRKTTCKPELAQRIAEVLGVDLELLFVPSSSNDERTFQPVKRNRSAA